MVFLFQFNYIEKYKKYPEVHQNELQEQIDNATVWAERFKARLNRLLKEYPGHEAIPEAELEAKIWEKDLSYLKFLQLLWDDPEKYETIIRKTEKEMDDNLIPIHEQGIETGITGLYKSDERDWNSRMILRDAYAKENRQSPLIPIRPDGAYLVSEALNGTSFLYFVAVILIILLNFDIWSKDFENETSRLLFTMPYSKKQIYLTRLIVRFIMSLISIFVCLTILFLIGYVKFGSGLERLIIVNQKGLNSFSFFNLSRLELLPLDKVIQVEKYILLELAVFIPYILLVYTVIQLVSFVSRNQMTSLIIPLIGLIMLITTLMLPKESYMVGANIFLYMQPEKMFLGDLGIGLPLSITLLFVVSLLLIGISLIILNKKEQY